MDICYAADNNFSMQTAVSIVSVLNTTKDTHLRFHILDSGLSEENRKTLTSLAESAHAEIYYYDVSAQLELIREKGQRQWGDICTYATWGRLFLTEVLPADISRILYLDGDVIAAASLAPLETMDLHGQPLGAVEDCTPHSHRKAIGMNPSSRYFNAGVLLLDMEMWRKMFPHPAVYLDHLLDREKPSARLSAARQYIMQAISDEENLILDRAELEELSDGEIDITAWFEYSGQKFEINLEV